MDWSSLVCVCPPLGQYLLGWVQSLPVVLMVKPLFHVFSPILMGSPCFHLGGCWMSALDYCLSYGGKTYAANVLSRVRWDTFGFIWDAGLFICTSIVSWKAGSSGSRVLLPWTKKKKKSCFRSQLKLNLKGRLFLIVQALVTCVMGGSRCSELSPLINCNNKQL